MKHNRRTRLAALLCAAALLAAAPPAAAASQPTFAVESAEVTQGGTCTLTVSGTGLKKLTSLKLTIAYDAGAFDVLETETQSMDLATANSGEDGIVQYSGISMDGISGEQTLLTVTFRAAGNAGLKTYPVALFVEGATAAGTSGDEPIEAAVQAGALTVIQSGTMNFHMYPSADAVKGGDEVTVTLSSYSNADLAGGRFVFTYDSSLLTYKEGSVELLPTMTESEYAVTVNSANTGMVSVAYAAMESVGQGDLMRLTFTVKNNVSGPAQITMTPESLTDVNAAPVSAPAVSTGMTVSEKPRMWFELPEGRNTHEIFAVGFWVNGTGGLAAGDFSIRYDPEEVECLSVTDMISGSGNGFLVLNDGYQDGSVEFSLLCPGGIQKDMKLLVITFRTRSAAETVLELVPSADTTPVDAGGNAIALECAPVWETVNAPNHRCENGVCADCGRDVAGAVFAGDQVKVAVPGLSGEDRVIVALYGTNGRLIRSKCCSGQEAASLLFDRAGAERAEVFVLDSRWCPLRETIWSD